MKDPTPEQAVRAVSTLVILHALIARHWDDRNDDALIDKAVEMADKLVAKVST